MEHETLFPLLCKTADGDKKAFAELYNITSPQLYAVALRLLGRDKHGDGGAMPVAPWSGGTSSPSSPVGVPR